jgi:hypothetical protein
MQPVDLLVHQHKYTLKENEIFITYKIANYYKPEERRPKQVWSDQF